MEKTYSKEINDRTFTEKDEKQLNLLGDEDLNIMGDEYNYDKD